MLAYNKIPKLLYSQLKKLNLIVCNTALYCPETVYVLEIITVKVDFD